VAGRLFDLDIPFFLPVWRRVAAVALAVGWGLFELSTGHVFWGMIFIGMGCIAGWKFKTADWSAISEEEAEDT